MSTMAVPQWNLISYLVILMGTIFLILLWKAVTLLIFNSSNIPSPKGSLLIGHLFQIMRSKDFIQTFDQWVKTYGPIVELRPLGILGAKNYLVSDADALKQILVTKSFRYCRPSAPRSFMSNKNVMLANGKEHSRMRKMINPAFKVNSVKSMVDVFYEKAKILTKFWNDTISAKTTSSNNEECSLFVQNDLTRTTLDALGACVLGYEFNSIEAGDTPITHAFNDIFGGVNQVQGFGGLISKVLDWLPFLKLFVKSHRKRMEAREIVCKTIKQVIDDKQEKQTDTRTRKDLLDLLLEAVDDETGQGMDNEELYSQLFIFLFAGHDTTSLGLSWTLYFLAQYPDVQENLRREVNETLKEQEKNWDTYDSMEYLAAVVNESLRLRPPAPIFRRRVIQEDNILGHTIPLGSDIVVSPYALHRRPEYWTDPEKFNPDRFLEPDKQNNPNNRFAFLPFSTGPRICVGYRFALMEMKTVLATLIQNFSFSMIPGMSFGGSFSVTYRPNPTLQLLVRKVSE